MNNNIKNKTQTDFFLSPSRQFTDSEKALIWKKPSSHIVSEEELRICQEVRRNWESDEMRITNILLEGDAGSGKTQIAKALSAEFGLPYTKVTCFADMDKADILGSILPILNENPSDHIDKNAPIEYKYYPSEIVSAYEKGYLLEIQEPTVIRDAAVLMALNSALEPDGSLNLPTGVIRRHPDFVVIITTNRNYAGCRSLNESLRDRIHHSEKMNLPSKEVMVARAISKTGFNDKTILELLADAIITLDKTAHANAIKGVAGMRSYLYWIDAVAAGIAPVNGLYQKVIYKITTDEEEIKILEDALVSTGLLDIIKKTIPLTDYASLGTVLNNQPIGQDAIRTVPNTNPIDQDNSNDQVMELKTWGKSEDYDIDDSPGQRIENAVRLKKVAEGEDSFPSEISEGGTEAADKAQATAFRKELNKEARIAVADSIHKSVKLIVHRPDYTNAHIKEYNEIVSQLGPIIDETARRTLPLLAHEESGGLVKSKMFGSHFNASSVATPDFRNFARKSPPSESPSLAVALRIDESASMSAFGRLTAAKSAAVAVYEFCRRCHLPILIYGDTADISKLEQMSLFAYADFKAENHTDKYRLMNISPRGNNRDGMALKILSDRLVFMPQKTKLLISISDGSPRALPDYTGSVASEDMQNVINHYERRGITYLAAAIGEDKESISQIYNKERFLDITDLKEFPSALVRVIARYL